jgi:hypothetical protein
MKRTLLACLFAVCGLCHAQDISERVKGKSDQPLPSPVIDPDAHIFGMAFGTPEADVVKAWGKPDGYLRLAGAGTCMIYGKSNALLFTDGKLSGIRIASHAVVDWKLADRLPYNPLFDKLSWRLSNGIGDESSLPQVRKILGDKFSDDGSTYERTYTTDKAIVRLDFSHYTNEGDSDAAYKVCGLTVEAK